MAAMYYTYLSSPYGKLLLAGNGDTLSFISFYGKDKIKIDAKEMAAWEQSPKPFGKAIEQLGQYFEGTRKTFDLPLGITGTDFQRAVLKALMAIPYGEVSTYSKIAASIGRPKAVRAVGTTNGQNVLPIVIPCHRVIGKDGKLTGYSAGLEIKQQLLDHEQKYQ